WWRRRRSLSFILNGSRCYNLIAEVPAEFAWRPQIHLATHHLGQFHFHPDDGKETGDTFRLELDQHVDIAFGAESRIQDRAKQRQFPSVVTDAEGLDLLTGDREPRSVNGSGVNRCTHRHQYCTSEESRG